MERESMLKDLRYNDVFQEWQCKLRNDELYLDLIIKSEYAKELIENNLKILIWFGNGTNNIITLQLNDEKLRTCNIEFLQSEFDDVIENFRREKSSKIKVIDFDVREK